MSLQNFDHQYKYYVAKADTTQELDKLAFNRIRSIARSRQEPERSLLLATLSAIKNHLL